MAGVIFAMKADDLKQHPFPASDAGLASAYSYCGGNGTVLLPPGSPASITVTAPPAGVSLVVSNGGFVSSVTANGVVDAAAFPDFQDALDATPSGGTLVIPIGTWTPSTSPSFTGLDRDVTTEGAVRIVGAAPGVVLSFSGAAASYDDVDLIRLRGSSCVVENLALVGTGSAGDGRGVAVIDAKSGGGTTNITHTALTRLYVHDTPSWGIEFDSSTGGLPWDNLIRECTVFDAASGGSLHYGSQSVSTVGPYVAYSEFDGPGFSTFGVSGLDRGAVHLDNCVNAAFYACNFQPTTMSPALSIYSGRQVALRNVHFETSGSSDTGQYIILTSGYIGNLVLEGWDVYRPDQTKGPRFIKTDSTTSASTIVVRDTALYSSSASTLGDDVNLQNASDVLRYDNLSTTGTLGITGSGTALEATYA